MRFTLGVNTFDVDLTSYLCSYESGVKWRNVGGVWHGLDYGINTAKLKTTVTISSAYANLVALREKLIEYARNGLSFSLAYEVYEPIYGAFTWATGETDLTYVDASAMEQIRNTGDPNPTLTIDLFMGATAFSNEVAFEYNEMPHIIKSIRRSGNPKGQSNQNEVNLTPVGFHHSENIAEVTYTERRVATFPPYLYGFNYLASVRANSFTRNVTENNWLFTPNAMAENVYVLDIQDDGFIDRAGKWAQYVVTYGKA